MCPGEATTGSRVEMGDGVGLAADEVIQSVGRVGVNKAIADPFGRFDTEDAVG